MQCNIKKLLTHGSKNKNSTQDTPKPPNSGFYVIIKNIRNFRIEGSTRRENEMVKVSRKPAGFLTGREAADRLDMRLSTFYNHVKTGKFKKIVLPGSSEGYFPREEIEKIAQARELVLLMYTTTPTTFSRATTEEDVKGIVDLCVAIYGIGGTPSLEARLEIWRHNPYSYYIVKQEGIVVGYISMMWLDDEALDFLMGPTKPRKTAGNGIYTVIDAKHAKEFVPGQPIDSLFISLGVRPGLSNQQQREYGFKLIRDSLDVIDDFARQGMPVKKLLATSERSDGIVIGRKLHMKEIKYPGDPIIRFELDLEKSDSKIAHKYRQLIASVETA